MIICGVGALVTGGASGLGAAVGARLARAGAKVTLLDTDADRGVGEAARIGCHFEPVDVSDASSVDAAIRAAEAVHGTARILVNCAGVGSPAKVVARDSEVDARVHFAKTVAINLVGTFNVTASFAACLIHLDCADEERGVIVNTASIAAFDGQIGQAAYAASKGGIVSMTLPIAREFARHAIRVVTVAPGLFRTPMLGGLPQEAQESLGAQVPFPSRLGEPDEYASLVEHILSNPMLNGEVIRLDGALRMSPR